MRRRGGLVLRSLGLRTVRLGRWGRGLRITPGLGRKVHEIARQLGIDRRTIPTVEGLESGYGGLQCACCEEFGLTGRLKFVPVNKPREPSVRFPPPPPLLTKEAMARRSDRRRGFGKEFWK
jgi:hypothetical protein